MMFTRHVTFKNYQRINRQFFNYIINNVNKRCERREVSSSPLDHPPPAENASNNGESKCRRMLLHFSNEIIYVFLMRMFRRGLMIDVENKNKNKTTAVRATEKFDLRTDIGFATSSCVRYGTRGISLLQRLHNNIKFTRPRRRSKAKLLSSA